MDHFGLDLEELLARLAEEDILNGDFPTITFELETETLPLARELSAETIARRFIAENPLAVGMLPVLQELAQSFIQTSNKDEYFASYLKALLRTRDFNLTPAEALEFLQRYYLTPSAGNSSSPKTLLSGSTDLSSEDVRILQYMGGAIIRKLFYHPSTNALQKTAIETLAAEVAEGSIAQERERPRAHNSSKTRLWGISEYLEQLLTDAEVTFRCHTLENPCLHISTTYLKTFLRKATVNAMIDDLTKAVPRNTAMSVVEKIFMKFTICRAHSYSKKFGNLLKEKPRIACPSKAQNSKKSLRKNLKKKN